MYMLRHDYKGVEPVTAFTTVAKKSCQKDSYIVLDNEESSTPPGAESYEVSSRRRNKSSRLQEQTSAAKAGRFANSRSARVELVPFPMILCGEGFVLGKIEYEGGHFADSSRERGSI